jgi:hypothetical protein
MKQTTLRTITMLGLFLTLAVASVHAQSSVEMRVNVPFDFSAGNAKLKAGVYTIRRSTGKILVLRALNETKDVFVLTPYPIQRLEGDQSGKLVFHRYGNQYYMAEAWTGGETIGAGLNESRGERRLARELAKTKIQRESVEILARTNLSRQ